MPVALSIFRLILARLPKKSNENHYKICRCCYSLLFLHVEQRQYNCMELFLPMVRHWNSTTLLSVCFNYFCYILLTFAQPSWRAVVILHSVFVSLPYLWLLIVFSLTFRIDWFYSLAGVCASIRITSAAISCIPRSQYNKNRFRIGGMLPLAHTSAQPATSNQISECLMIGEHIDSFAMHRCHANWFVGVEVNNKNRIQKQRNAFNCITQFKPHHAANDGDRFNVSALARVFVHVKRCIMRNATAIAMVCVAVVLFCYNFICGLLCGALFIGEAVGYKHTRAQLDVSKWVLWLVGIWSKIPRFIQHTHTHIHEALCRTAKPQRRTIWI